MKHRPRHTLRCVMAVASLLPAVFASGASPSPPTTATTASRPATSPANQPIKSMLEETREAYDIPGIAVAIFNSNSIPVQLASGRRRLGSDAWVTLKDKFHVGSNGKAMTATLVALLVKDGKLSWSLKPAEVFPELAGTIDPGYRLVTLQDLLRHRAGIKPFLEDSDFNALAPLIGTETEQRYQFTKWLLAQKPHVAPGEFAYSNAGYAIVGAMVERLTGQSYEQLMRKRLFEPLNLAADFGWPALRDRDQPWGHCYSGELMRPAAEWKENGKLVVHPPDDEKYSSLGVPLGVLAPAGNVHLSVVDFARFAQMHLKGLRGQQTLLEPEMVKKLHEDIDGHAMGWVIVRGPGDIRISWHSGSGGTFYSQALVFPKTDVGIVLVANAGHKKAWKGCAALMQKLFDRYRKTGIR